MSIEITDWLRGLGLEQYAAAFRDNDIDGEILRRLTAEDLRELGDYAVMIRAKMMTVPGEQFVIRRKAYAMIKNAFDKIGIKFAFPTVR